MNLQKRVVVWSLMLFGMCLILHAQDPSFTQYFSAPMYLNPALTGFEGGTSIHLNHRDQWFWVGERPTKFYTEAFGADVELGCINSAIGITYMHNVEGAGRYRWQSGGLSFARKFGGRNAYGDWELSLGLRMTYNRRTLHWDRFIFSDQLDPVHGVVRATDLAFPTDNITESQFTDLDFGATVYQESKRHNSLVAGFAVNHIAQINNSIQNINDTLPLRGTIHVAYAYRFSQNRSYYFIPTLKLETQRSASAQSFGEFFSQGFFYRSILIGSGFDFQYKSSIWGGVWFHRRGLKKTNTNSLIVMIGGELGEFVRQAKVANRYRIGLSYDMPISGIRSDGGGSWEVSLSANFSELSLFNCRCLINPFSRPKFR
ncbi:MAG: PorP/SprF family type IX secretion system membrane protein [Bacteroidota bacterium]